MFISVLSNEVKHGAGWLCPQSSKKLEWIQYIVRFLLALSKDQW